MKSIQFFGGCGMVTGSCYLLTGDNGEQILVDLGLFQESEELGKLNYEALPFDILKLSGVVLTHAHLDHCGRLPLLTNAGYTGKIYMTQATRMLTSLVLLDAAKVAAENNSRRHGDSAQIPPAPFNKGGKRDYGSAAGEGLLYSEEDVDNLLSKIENVEYDQAFSMGEFAIVFRDAGHILGSAIVEITDAKGKKIVFSGDLGNTPEDMIRPTEHIAAADFVVMESTYGNRIHKEESPTAVLHEEINEIEKTGGVLLIPSFSIERAQELLHRINHLKKDNKIDEGTKVFLDSPMAIRATEIFRQSPELYNQELTKENKTDDPFDFPGLNITSSAEDSRAIVFNPGPKVIISGSGMMHGGRVLHHAVNYLPDNKTRLLIVGYQAPGTLGRHLLDGAKSVVIYNQEIAVAAHIRSVEAMSCHADQKKLLQWLRHIHSVKKVFLTHGEDEARNVLGEKIRSGLGIQEVVMPKLGEKYNLLYIGL